MSETNGQLAPIVADLGMSSRALALALDAPRSTVQRWLGGQRAPAAVLACAQELADQHVEDAVIRRELRRFGPCLAASSVYRRLRTVATPVDRVARQLRAVMPVDLIILGWSPPALVAA